MDHKRFIDRISSYLSGDLNGEELAEFEIHFINCQNCRDRLLANRLVYMCAKEFILTSDLPSLEGVLNIEAIFEEFRQGYRKISLVSLRDKIRVLSKRMDQIKKLSDLRPRDTFGFDIIQFEVARGQAQRKNAYNVGEYIIVFTEIPMEGYLTIFHYDDLGHLKLLFPHKKTDITFVKKGEKKRMGMKVAEPKGKQCLTAILTTRQIIRPEDIIFDDDIKLAQVIEKFLDTLSRLSDHEWMKETREFEVIGT